MLEFTKEQEERLEDMKARLAILTVDFQNKPSDKTVVDNALAVYDFLLVNRFFKGPLTLLVDGDQVPLHLWERECDGSKGAT